jgi:hypothetical protein
VPYTSTAWWSDIGPVALSFKGTVLPDTAGGARYRHSIETVQSFRDKHGNRPVNEIVVGTPIDFEADLAIETIDAFASLLPGVTLGTGTVKKALQIKSAVGYDMLANAGELIVKPIVDGVATTDESLWLKFPKAHPKVNFDVVRDLKSQSTYKVAFVTFPDDDGVYATMGADSSST